MQDEKNVNSPETGDETIPEMVDEVRAGRMSRRKFAITLAAMGISAIGITTITAVATREIATRNATSAVQSHHEKKNLDLHQQHLFNQNQGNIDELKHDYAQNAVVEDSMFSEPFVGHEAILARKGRGLSAFPNLKITATNRVASGNQVTVEWVATGVHNGDFPGLPASGRSFSIPGVTVVVRQQGKIVRESIYYSMAEVRQQLSAL